MAKHRKKGEQAAFLLYNDSKIYFDNCQDEEAGQLIKAIFSYKVDGELPQNLPRGAEMAFYAIRNYLDRDAESYKETCAQNAINGQKGGKVTQEKARKAKQANATITKANQADNENVNGIIIEKDLKSRMENGALSFPSEQAINWRSFKKLAIEAYGEVESDFALEKCLEIFKYFFTCYQRCTGKAHPPLKKEQIINIIEKMPYITSELHGWFDTEPENYKVLIDKYFETPFNNCDYRINHFFSGDIRTNRFYEELY